MNNAGLDGSFFGRDGSCCKYINNSSLAHKRLLLEKWEVLSKKPPLCSQKTHKLSVCSVIWVVCTDEIWLEVCKIWPYMHGYTRFRWVITSLCGASLASYPVLHHSYPRLQWRTGNEASASWLIHRFYSCTPMHTAIVCCSVWTTDHTLFYYPITSCMAHKFFLCISVWS